ncbi:MAG: phosphoenolpyruvate synthase [Flavisolibacter sp.]
MSKLIRSFREISRQDVAVVGGKNASLGEMFNQLSSAGVLVPDGFATTTAAFRLFLAHNNLEEPLRQLLMKLDRKTYNNLNEIGSEARALLLKAKMPEELKQAITGAWASLVPDENLSVAVRSSATAEDLAEASFAGLHESYLNICSLEKTVEAVQRCFASLYTNRAIKYREERGFDHEKVALSAGIQKMVRADLACSGVAFTIEPESGFSDLIHINGVWGLGENLVQGTVTPDEFLVFKPTLVKGKDALLQKKLGEKAQTLIFGTDGNDTINTITVQDKRDRFVLNDQEVLQLARACLVIEKHYGRPMDIEWAKDGLDQKIYIIQARPETVQSLIKAGSLLKEYTLSKKGTILTSGQAVGNKVAVGPARLLASPQEAERLQPGDIVVTSLTSPDWDPYLQKVAAIVTDRGGRTSHASIVARELGVPAVVGCQNATKTISDGEIITVSCCEGKQGNIYRGALPFVVTEIDFSSINKPESTDVMLILGDPEKAFQYSFYPNDGVGLMRLEFIITHFVQVHPMALVRFDQVKEENDRAVIEKLTKHYPDKPGYFVERLAEGIATIAAAFYPKDVVVRMSDFKTNEYANLIGGRSFEPEEENPMIGFRGASRYYHDLYREGFQLECAAVKKVREQMGLDNVKIMIPFCRTIEEAKMVIHTIAANGLDRDRDSSLEIYMMAEIPSNVLLAEKFAALFDGFSIGSNDLTQLTLGIDRDSALVSHLFDEKDEAAKLMISTMIRKARESGTRVGLCGQAPSDDPEYAQFLVRQGIDSISFTPDALLKGIENILLAEEKKTHAAENEILTF